MKSIFLFAMALASGLAVAKPVVDTVNYRDGETKLQGYFVYDDAVKGRRPGVVIVHTWAGVTGYEVTRAKQLAALGYTAFVADIYGADVRPKNAKEYAANAGKYKGDRPLFQSRLKAAYDQLIARRETDKSRVGAMGYCFGGTGVLELARTGVPLKGVVSFHGGLEIADLGRAKCAFLILHGDADPFVPKKDIDNLMTMLDQRKLWHKLVRYPGAVHAFTVPTAGNDPSTGAAYNEEADKKSFEEMRGFFKQVFGR